MPKNIDDTKYFADKYFQFLITDFEFDKVPDYYVSYEYHTAYRKDKIEINIACEADGTSLPWVTLGNFKKTQKIGDNEYPEYFYLTEIEVPDSIKKIFQRRSDRCFPLDSDQDYEKYGRQELELLLKENAEIIKSHSRILSGDLEIFPKKKNNKNSTIKTEISIRQGDGTYKVVSTTETKPKLTILERIRSWFN